MTRDARALPEEDGFPNGDELQRLGVGGWGRGAWRRVGVRRRKSEDERGEGVELSRADRGAPHFHGAEDRSSCRVLDGIEASVGPIREVLGGLEQTGRLSEDLNGLAGSVGDLKEMDTVVRSEEHTSELQSPCNLVCRLLLEKKKKKSELRVVESITLQMMLD